MTNPMNFTRTSRSAVRRWASALVLGFSLLCTTASGAFAEMLAVGAEFPGWRLLDDRGIETSSADLAGESYLLWFYPKAMTPGCTIEARTLRTDYPDFDSAGVAVFGISFDSPAENARFVEAEQLPFRLLSDTRRELAVAVGAADDAAASHARRISYLVGPNGKVVAAYPNVDPATHAQQVLKDCCSGDDRREDPST